MWSVVERDVILKYVRAIITEISKELGERVGNSR